MQSRYTVAALTDVYLPLATHLEQGLHLFITRFRGPRFGDEELCGRRHASPQTRAVAQIEGFA